MQYFKYKLKINAWLQLWWYKSISACIFDRFQVYYKQFEYPNDSSMSKINWDD